MFVYEESFEREKNIPSSFWGKRMWDYNGTMLRSHPSLPATKITTAALLSWRCLHFPLLRPRNRNGISVVFIQLLSRTTFKQGVQGHHEKSLEKSTHFCYHP